MRQILIGNSGKILKGAFDNMKSPLIKRLPRELKKDFGKYLVIFVFMIATIGFVSGFLVADNSLKKTYDDSFEKFNIEDGHFIFTKAIDRNLKENLENNMKIKIYNNVYIDAVSEKDHTVRIFKIRNEINRADLIRGNWPSKDNDIVIDRLYAENNNIKIGDIITAGIRNIISADMWRFLITLLYLKIILT